MYLFVRHTCASLHGPDSLDSLAPVWTQCLNSRDVTRLKSHIKQKKRKTKNKYRTITPRWTQCPISDEEKVHESNESRQRRMTLGVRVEVVQPMIRE